MLYPTVLREVVLGCARAGLFRPLWSARILEEWARATAKLGPGAEAVARGEVAMLRAGWPGAEVRPRDGDMARLWLPDPNDVHVLAAAMAGYADVLLTLNARDFPRRDLAAEGIERLSPDQLLTRLHDACPAAVASAVHAVHAEVARLTGAPPPLRGLLKRAGLPRLAKRMAE